MNINYLWLILGCLLLLGSVFGVGMWVQSGRQENKPAEVTVKFDTLKLHDTTIIAHEVPPEIVRIWVHDTVKVPPLAYASDTTFHTAFIGMVRLEDDSEQVTVPTDIRMSLAFIESPYNQFRINQLSIVPHPISVSARRECPHPNIVMPKVFFPVGFFMHGGNAGLDFGLGFEDATYSLSWENRGGWGVRFGLELGR